MHKKSVAASGLKPGSLNLINTIGNGAYYTNTLYNTRMIYIIFIQWVYGVQRAIVGFTRRINLLIKVCHDLWSKLFPPRDTSIAI